MSRQTPVVFYSWQSDLPGKCNRGLIKDALEKACKELSAELSLAVRVDSDVQGQSGSPDIARTILEKIDAASVMVADVSIIGKTAISRSEPQDYRAVPNPNVMLELGYAKKALGPSRVIMVCNTAFGRIEDLPFDIRGKSVLSYAYEGGDDKPGASRNELREKLKRALVSALKAAEGSSNAAAQDDKDNAEKRSALFREWRAKRAQEVTTTPPVELDPGPLMAIQLVPLSAVDGTRHIEALNTAAQSLLTEMSPYATTSWGWHHDVDSITATGMTPSHSYTRLFDTGALEHVVVVSSAESNPNIDWVAHLAIKGLAKMLPAIAKLGLQGDCLASLDVHRTMGARIAPARAWLLPNQNGRTISRQSLTPDPIVLPAGTRADAIAGLIRPALDWIWRAAGYENCFLFGEDGRWRRT
jgi:hypothetical protein